MMKKIVLMCLLMFAFLLSGCEKDPKELEKNNEEVIDLGVTDTASEVLYHDENSKSMVPEETGLELYVISDSAIGHKLSVHLLGEEPSIYMTSKSMDNQIVDPNESMLYPSIGGDVYIRRDVKEIDKLASEDFVELDCIVILKDDVEVKCANSLLTENLLGYKYGPAYIVEDNGNFYFRTTKD